MEKTSRSNANSNNNSNFFAFLPKTSSIVSFSNAPFSPSGKDRRQQDNHGKLCKVAGKSFSGPIVSIIPKEARMKSKDSSFVEPTSPKVSCIGQIKIKKKKKKLVKEEHRQENPPMPEKKAFQVKKLFQNGRKLGAIGKKCRPVEEPPPVAAPKLGQMKRFSSRRDVLANFDWKDSTSFSDRRRDYYSDEERDNDDDDDDDDEEEEAVIPFSCPIIVGGEIALEPRKEVNLWKRRTMAPPGPLLLNNMGRKQ